MTTLSDTSSPHYALFLPQIRMSFDTILERVLVAESLICERLSSVYVHRTV